MDLVSVSRSNDALSHSMRRMKERAEMKLENARLEVQRINKLLARETADPLRGKVTQAVRRERFERKTKLLNKLGPAEAAVKEAESFLRDVLGQLEVK